MSKSSNRHKPARNSQLGDSQLPPPAAPAALAAAAPSAAQLATGPATTGRFAKALGKLKHLKGAIVGIAGVGAVLSGFVGYYTTYKTVAEPQANTKTTDAAKPVNSKSIAVLPFANMSGDKTQEYFSDGISEELLNQLTKVRDLLVIGRTSSFSYKGKDIKLEQIGRDLNVAHILQGSVRKSGNKVRITAQLIRAADSSQIWSETYDRDMSDIFAVQDDISAAVVEQLKAKLLGAAPKAVAAKPEAYALYLQARTLTRLRTGQGYTQAIALLKQALQIDPGYAAAWEQLAGVYIGQADNSLRPVAEGYRLAREAANKALASEPQYAPTYIRLAWIAMSFDGDFAAAARFQNQAIALGPDDNTVMGNTATLAQYLDRPEVGIAINEALLARDPANIIVRSNLGFAYYLARRYDDAIASYRKALGLSAANLNAHYSIGMALLQKGQPQAALAEMQLEPAEGGWGLVGLPMVWHALGDKAQSDAVLAQLIRLNEKDSAFNIAYVYAYRGQADPAFAWLDKAVAYQDPGLAGIVPQPEFANIRKDPRWLPFLRKIGRAPEQLAAIKLDVKPPGR